MKILEPFPPRLSEPIAIILIIVLGAAGVFAQNIDRVSIDTSRTQGNIGSDDVAVSSDGRYVAFLSDATNLVSGDTNGEADVFVHDLATGSTTRVSVDSSGAEANGPCDDVSISSNGRYVAFRSDATNLVTGDTNGATDAFVHDRTLGTTARISIGSSNVEGVGTTSDVAISGDGNFAVFSSNAANLVAGDTNSALDIFVHDRTLGTTERVSVDSSGVEANSASVEPSISADGRFVAFQSFATNLASGDANGEFDIFVHDRTLGTTERVSVDSSGAEANGINAEASINSDGRYVAFRSSATNLVAGDTNAALDIFVHDRTLGTTERVSVDSSGAEAQKSSSDSDLSDDGRFVTFASFDESLVPNDLNGALDIFVHDRTTGSTTRASVNSSGVEANGNNDNFAISGDGRFVAFSSEATNLIASDTNAVADVFIHDRLDLDGDDILDDIDTRSTVSSANFSDGNSGGVTSGLLQSRGDQTFITIEDSTLAAPNDGVLITTGADLGSGQARIDACTPTTTTRVASGARISITCTSFTIRALEGSAEVTFRVAEQDATTTINAVNQLSFDTTNNFFTTPFDNTGTVVVFIANSPLPLRPGAEVCLDEEGDCEDDDEDEDGDNDEEGEDADEEDEEQTSVDQ